MTERVLLVADIHANDHALQAVFQHANRSYAGERYQTWFAGDLFGRGPDARQAFRQLMNRKPNVAIAGNHDWGIIGRNKNINIKENSPDEKPQYHGDYNNADWLNILKHRQELQRYQSQLWLNGAKDKILGTATEYIQQLPVVAVPYEGIYVVHGGIQAPTFMAPSQLDQSFWNALVWGYIKEKRHAVATIDGLRWLAKQGLNQTEIWCATQVDQSAPKLVIVGHVHCRRLLRGQIWESVESEKVYALAPLAEEPVLIGLSSVGFSADSEDRDANYAMLTLEDGHPTSVVFHRVPYDRAAVLKRMQRFHYPQETMRRLLLPNEQIGELTNEP